MKASSTHHFTLALRVDALTDELEAKLFEAGCDDAALYQTGTAVFLEFDREAPSREEAIRSALLDVQEGAKVAVLRVLSNDLVNAAQIAERLGRSRESVRLLVQGERGPGGFPPPAHHVGERPLWSWGDVVEWLAANRLEDVQADEANGLIEAVNCALTLVRAEQRLSETSLRYVAGLLGERLRSAVTSSESKS